MGVFQNQVEYQKRAKGLCFVDIVKSPKAFKVARGERKTDDAIYLGLEWEMLIKGFGQNGVYFETKKDKLNSIGKLVMTALDSPLGQHANFRSDAGGIELVTIPATLKAHKAWMEKHLFPTGFTSHIAKHRPEQTVGIHIHISKKAFTKESLQRFIFFMRSIDNMDFNRKIAGRTRYYDSKTKTGLTSDVRTIQVSDRMYDEARHGKYEIVNTSGHHDTIEIRVFNSVKSKSALYARLEYMDALVRYTRQETDNSLQGFACFVKNNVLKYPNLAREKAVKQIRIVS